LEPVAVWPHDQSAEDRPICIALDEVRAPVRRRVEVQLAVRLDQLHRIIQVVMGWENHHLYEFRDGAMSPMVFPIVIGTSPETTKTPLAGILARSRNKSFKYAYDIGDDWWHAIKAKAIADTGPEATYPWFLSAQGRRSPEDVVGTCGSAPYLEAMVADPKHERAAEMVTERRLDSIPTPTWPTFDGPLFSSFATHSQRKPKSIPGA
jgi:Plasmid pRiA4b ORF-3-like protein